MTTSFSTAWALPLALTMIGGAASAQGTFSCPDDSGTVNAFYANTGTADHQVNLKPDESQDHSFKVKVWDSDGTLIATIEVSVPNNIPVITVPPKGSLTLEDSTDADADGVAGTYTVT